MTRASRHALFRMALPIAMASALAIGTALAPPGAHAQRLPALDGLVVWDEPRAPDAIRDGLARASRMLRDRPRPPRRRSLEAATAWISDVLVPWVAARRAAIEALERDMSALAAAGPRERIAGAVIVARVWEDTVAVVEGTRPAAVLADPELLRIYDDALVGATAPLLGGAAAAYGACARVEIAPEPLRATIAACAQRYAATRSRLDAIEARLDAFRAATPPRPPPRGAVVGADRVPAACTRGVVTDPAPEINPPPGAPLEIAVVFPAVSMLLNGGERARETPPATRERIAAAVQRTLARDRTLRLVPRADVRRAERLVAERRARAGGPVCARAPSIAEVLATDHPNLGLAWIETTCWLAPEAGCWLDVTFLRPPGGPAVDLPPPLRGRAPEGGSATAAWLAAARAIGTAAPETTGVLGVFTSDSPIGADPSPPPRVRLAGVADDAPELRAPETLWLREYDLAGCFDGRGTARVDVAIAIAADGTTREVRASADPESVIGAAADVERVGRCVERALARASWPCPPGGTGTIEATICIGE